MKVERAWLCRTAPILTSVKITVSFYRKTHTLEVTPYTQPILLLFNLYDLTTLIHFNVRD